MAHAITNSPGITGYETPGFLKRLKKSFSDYGLYRDTLADLQALSERELFDLGISRYDIEQIARESVYGG
jgi:uncharacterized protein YjiS (DUF1127 family)